MKLILPTKRQAVKWALGITGTILLGALGSGVWQSVLGPGIHASTRWALDLASLGLKSFKDSIYLQVAADDQARIAARTLFLVTFLQQFVIIATTLVTLFFYQESKKILKSLSSDSQAN